MNIVELPHLGEHSTPKFIGFCTGKNSTTTSSYQQICVDLVLLLL